MRSERDLLDRAYMLVGHALPAALQTEIKAALGITPPVLLDDIAKLISLARRTMWIALCWNDHNFDAANKYAKTEVDKAGFTNIERANAWLEKMESSLTADVGAIAAENALLRVENNELKLALDMSMAGGLSTRTNLAALQARIDDGTRVYAWDFEGKLWANINKQPFNATLILDDGVVL